MSSRCPRSPPNACGRSRPDSPRARHGQTTRRPYGGARIPAPERAICAGSRLQARVLASAATCAASRRLVLPAACCLGARSGTRFCSGAPRSRFPARVAVASPAPVTPGARAWDRTSWTGEGSPRSFPKNCRALYGYTYICLAVCLSHASRDRCSRGDRRTDTTADP